MTLEDKIRDAAKRGELTHLSVIPTRRGWSASYAPATKWSHSIETRADPVEALIAAIDGFKLRKLRAAASPKDSVDSDFG